MEINVSNNDGELLLKPIGRLDSATSEELEEEINKNFDILGDDIKSLTIDLEKVDFISSKGIRVLVGAYKKLNGKALNLNNVNNSIKEVIRLSGLDKAFNIQ